LLAPSSGAASGTFSLRNITDKATKDKQNGSLREQLAAKADFLGAIRLPSDAFQREGTRVVTDIVFLRKRAAGEPAHHADPDWLAVAPLAIDGVEIPINRYFLTHPDMRTFWRSCPSRYEIPQTTIAHEAEDDSRELGVISRRCRACE
jgi:hypothetical protein